MYSSVLKWFHSHMRSFPWRDQTPRDPFTTWVCEVMSQQTSLAVVEPYLTRFLTQIPSRNDLAQCPDSLLREVWSGLGYYSRAQNLRKGAQWIEDHFKGHWPTTYSDWLTVPGCGPYTAAMVSSLCFGDQTPALDGNVIRVLSRFLGLKEKEEVWTPKAQQKMIQYLRSDLKTLPLGSEKKDAFLFNEALIELGATLCRKHSPLCPQCPLKDQCQAYLKGWIPLCPPVKPKPAFKMIDLLAIGFYRWNESSLEVEIALSPRETGFLKTVPGFYLSDKSFDKVPLSLRNQAQIGTKTLSHTITHHRITCSLVALPFSFDQLDLYKLWLGLDPHTQGKALVWYPAHTLSQHLSTSLDQKIGALLLKMLGSVTYSI